MQVIEVEWLDSNKGCADWHDIDDVDESPVIKPLHSWGALIQNTVNAITLAQTLNWDDSQILNTIQIPRCAVRKITVLSNYEIKVGSATAEKVIECSHDWVRKPEPYAPTGEIEYCRKCNIKHGDTEYDSIMERLLALPHH